MNAELGTPRTQKTADSAFLDFSVADCRSQNEKTLIIEGARPRQAQLDSWGFPLRLRVRVRAHV